jgi:DNA modification methylase
MLIIHESSIMILTGDCLQILPTLTQKVDMTFLDPPFNQNKAYAHHDDAMPEVDYWAMMKEVCQLIYRVTNPGGCVYFMQREKNAEFVLKTLRETNWVFQNLIIWKKRTSAVPVNGKYGKQYQIIAYATKGDKAKTFNRLRINPPLLPHQKIPRENGIFVTDVWDDIKELTSGFFAGDEALRTETDERFHKQQAPLALLLRLLLTSTNIGDTILDPYSGTGTTAVVASQIGRNSISIEIDPTNVQCIETRLNALREADDMIKYLKDYRFTDNISQITGQKTPAVKHLTLPSLTLF